MAQVSSSSLPAGACASRKQTLTSLVQQAPRATTFLREARRKETHWQMISLPTTEEERLRMELAARVKVSGEGDDGLSSESGGRTLESSVAREGKRSRLLVAEKRQRLRKYLAFQLGDFVNKVSPLEFGAIAAKVRTERRKRFNPFTTYVRGKLLSLSSDGDVDLCLVHFFNHRFLDKEAEFGKFEADCVTRLAMPEGAAQTMPWKVKEIDGIFNDVCDQLENEEAQSWRQGAFQPDVAQLLLPVGAAAVAAQDGAGSSRSRRGGAHEPSRLPEGNQRHLDDRRQELASKKVRGQLREKRSIDGIMAGPTGQAHARRGHHARPPLPRLRTVSCLSKGKYVADSFSGHGGVARARCTAGFNAREWELLHVADCDLTRPIVLRRVQLDTNRGLLVAAMLAP
jgi:hypothetical protein